MAKFRGVLRGNCGGVSRLGNRLIEASVCGWDVGVDIKGHLDESGAEVFTIAITNGSPTEGKTKQIIKTLTFTKADIVVEQLANIA